MKLFTDPTLPGLTTALNLDVVLELLRKALEACGDDVEVIEGNILDVQYKPGVSCRLLYRLKVQHRESHHSDRQLLSAQVLRVDEAPPSPPHELLARYGGHSQAGIRTPMLYLPAARMVVYAFPIDTFLPCLLDALDPSVMTRELKRMWARRDIRVRRVMVEPLGYTPAARATLLCEVLGEGRNTAVPEVRRLVGKIHAHKPPAKLFAAAWALWRAANGRVRLAPPVGYIASLKLTLQEQVRGQRLPDLAQQGSFIKPVRQAARALATLHGLSLPLLSERTPEREAQVVQRWGSVLTTICPALARHVERLGHRLAAELEAQVQMRGPVHGDFHPANVLWDGNHVTLIDLDEMAYGDPLVDVGRFLASLRVSALRISTDPSALTDVGEAFLEQYLTRTAGDERRARLFEAASLLVAAASPFRLQRPGWENAAATLIEEAERVWENASPAAAIGVGSQVPSPDAPIENPPRWTNDGVYMQAILDPYIRTVYGADITTCRVSATPANDHAERIRYELRGWQADEKWGVSVQGIVWRGPGGRTLVHRLEALRSALEGSPTAPLLPQPIAYLRPLSLLVWAQPSGVSFSSLINKGDGLEDAATRVAHALATLHRTFVELGSVHSLDDELLALRQKVQRLEDMRPDLLPGAIALSTAVDRQSRVAPVRHSPIVHTVHPQDVLCVGERVAFVRVEKLTLSHPFIDVGDFLARLMLLGIKCGKVQEVAAVVDRIRQAYKLALGITADGMAAFEAGAL
ncbi:MAG TPA: aminoglycoside phosphotransferase family protein, partial [Candidatus Tectomicrobia bacterium]|nr:aminoglycoside phosphotransferase family protein [Candidatus Tectomicrobia bacterium]